MKNIRWVLIAASLCAWNSSARAEETGPCREDVEKFCKEVQPGEGRIIDCLKQHKDELSQACRQQGEKTGEKMKEARRDMKEACQQDADSFCKDMTPGNGLLKCLHTNKEKLTEDCRKALKRAKHHRQKMHGKMRGHKKESSEYEAKPAEPGAAPAPESH